MTPEKENRRGCYALIAIIVLLIAIGLWMALGTQSLGDAPASDIPAAGDPTSG